MEPLYKDKEWLYNQYYHYNKSCKKIAEEHGYKHSTVNKYFRLFGFKARPNGRELVGKKPHNFKGLHKMGKYLGRYAPEHPNADKYGRVFEHRYVMSNHLGRRLETNEVVHHINGDTHDNRIENLQLFDSPGKHTSIAHKRPSGIK